MMIADKPEAVSEVVFDPYLYRTEMPLTAVFYPLGFPVRISTNSAAVLEAAEQSWGMFALEFYTPTIEMNIGVQEGDTTECPPAPGCRARRNLMLRIADQDNFYVADLLQGFSLVWVTAAAVANQSYFRYHFLESAALCHIASRYAAPVHAACVEKNGRGVLLCGDSGAGKSSLAFACARAGWTYVSDDSSLVLHAQQESRVVGNRHTIRFRPSAAPLFAEVAGRPITPRAVGKPSIELDTAMLADIRTASSAQIDLIVFLNRNNVHTQELLPYSRVSAREYMHKHLSGMEELRAQQVVSVERLLTAVVLELRYRDLDWAVERLERMLRGDG